MIEECLADVETGNALAESELVTKQDLKLAMTELKSDLKVWMAMALLAQSALVVTLQNLLGG